MRAAALVVSTCLALGLVGTPGTASAAHLTFLGALFDGAGGADGLEHAQDLVVSPDGLHVYVASEEENAVALYARDASTGALGFVQKWVDGVGGVDGTQNPIGLAVSPDGAHVYATGSLDNGLAVFARDAGTGLLTFVEAEHDGVAGVDGLDGPANVTLSPDGAHVYVAAWDDWGTAVFSRDPVTGALTFVEAEIDGVGGVTGLANATSLDVAPDGKHVYVASEGSDAVAVFARDAGSGALTFLEAEVDGMTGDGLGGAVSVVVSPDGDHVYVGSLQDDAIATFARDATTGALTFAGAEFDGVGGIDGLDRPLELAMSADGTKLYVAGSYDDHAVVVFERDPPTGTLAFLEIHRNGSGGVTGLIGCNTVRTSPEGKHVYTTARDPGSLAVLATPAGLPTTTSTTPASSTTVTSTSSTTSSTLPSSTSTTSSTTSSTALSTSTISSTSSSTTSSTPTTTVSTTLPSTSTIPASTTSTSIVGSTTTSSTTSTTTTPSSTTSSTSTTLVGCTLSPRSGCREAPKTRFAVRNRTRDVKDRLRFRWKRGAATALTDFGTPEGGTTYRLCVYRDGALGLEAAVPPGGTCGKRPCWRPTKKGFRYADRSGAADGIKTIVLKSGGDGAAAVGVAGAGEGLPLPPEPLAPPLVVQVQASDAACWSGEVAAP